MLKDIDLERTGGRERLRGALRDGSFLVRTTVPESLLEEAYGFLRAFFALPAEEKGACRVPGGNGQAGYLALPARPAGEGTVGEGRELFHWGARLPARHPLRVRFPARYPDPYFPDHLVPGIGSALRELHARMLHFQHRVVRSLADALGAHPDYFTDLLEDGPAVNRATWHPPARHPAAADRRVREAAHQDPDLITTLPRASAPGLEVLADGEWLPADAPPGHAVVSVGTALDRLTDGVARAAVRRVVARPGHGEGRLSLAQSCHPAPWATLAPLHALGGAPRPRRFATLTAEELFQRALYGTGAPAGHRPGPATR
ncbi:isopenicillin N synthase family oxygenase [Streptomyces tagetis]|uniref:Isopenicillin N synthase family oxygenase n=1 Tax=Streptomyces tagetis TaxID=2820809 RepID=A0A940XHC7_9ACTN|nr:isopenicillin N synthase family oxygenase [Streptomyces sp. RG38]MBQ0827192.1 isopenicillin N synthase family oxygenase [Streptomyces sp. RG38]